MGTSPRFRALAWLAYFSPAALACSSHPGDGASADGSPGDSRATPEGGSTDSEGGSHPEAGGSDASARDSSGPESTTDSAIADTAASDGTSNDAPSQTTSHEPGGMTTVVDTGPITTGAPTTPTGKSDTAWSSGGSVPITVTILNGVTGTIQLSSTAASEAQSSGWRVTFPAAQVNDAAMSLGLPWSATHGTGTLYMRYRMRLGSSWSGAALNAGQSKLFAPKDDGGSDDIVMSYLDGPTAVPGYPFGVGLQGPTTDNIPTTESTAPASDVYQAAVWNTFEVLITPDAPAGAGNGTVSLWVNGGTVFEKTGVSIFAKGATMGWHSIDMYASRAVYDGTQTTTTFLDIDELHASVK